MLANVAVIREDAAMDFDARRAARGAGGRGAGQAPPAARAPRRRRVLRGRAGQGGQGEPAGAATGRARARRHLHRRRGRGAHRAARRDMARIRRQHGLPAPDAEDRVFSDEDVEAARSMKLFLDAGFADERVDEITRVLGEGMGRLRRRSPPRSWRRSWRPARARTRWRCASPSWPSSSPRRSRRSWWLGSPPTCATASSAACWGWPSSRPATSPAPRTWPSASPTSSGSRGWAARSRWAS